MAVEIYECSGIRMASDIPLSAPRSIDQSEHLIDVRLELGEARVQAFERPSDDIIAELTVEGYPWYTFCRVDNGYTGRIPGVADFVIDGDLKRVVCHPALDDRSKVIPIIVPGTVTAFLLAMSGRFVLHGSAVDLDGQALAFVGASGQGKTTMAAMFCAAGTTLVTDDVLPLEFASGPDGTASVLCLRAGNELRLREKSASLADRFDKGTAVRVTEDERRAVSPGTTPHERLPLSAIVLPRPDREHADVSARRLGGAEASFWLARCQRIEGWRVREQLRKQFTEVGRVVAAVPVFEVSVPWGPPFAADLPQQVLDACDLSGLLQGTS